MPLNSFLDKFRRPSFTAGPVMPTFDSDDRQLDILMSRTAPGGSRIERGTNPLMRMAQPGMRMSNPDPRPRGMSGGNADGSPNVVYDAGTELAFKRFDEAKRQNKEQERLREKQIESTAGLQNAKLGIQRGGLDIKSQQLALQQFKAMNPNMIIKQVPGGNFIAIDPQSGDVVDTGISSGRMDESARIAAQGANRIDVANINQEGANTRQQRNAQSALERLLIGGDINIQRDGNKYSNKPGSAPKGNDLTRRAFELISARPELAKFVTIDDEGNVKVAQPGATPGGLNLIQKGVKSLGQLFTGEEPDLSQENTSGTLDENTWKQINMALYAPTNEGISKIPFVANEMEKSQKANAEQAGANQVMRKTQTNRRTGAKRSMISTDGGKTWRPE